MKEKIYLLPGLMCDERLWERMIPYLEDEYELIHIPVPLSTNFDDIIKELDTIFGDEKVNILGFSMGAYIASHFAIAYPHRVNKLFLTAGTPSEMTQDEIEKRNHMLEMMKTLGFKGLSYKKTKSLLEKSNQEDEELIKLIQNMYTDLGEEVYISQIKTVNTRQSLEKKLIDLDIPIKLFYSTDDRLLNYNSLEHFTDDHEHITKIPRKGESHMIPLEAPKQLSNHVRNWMLHVKN